MYTIQENVQITIAALKQYNIKHIVVSPGGTNIPISQAVQADDFFHCYSVVDERSAMYVAIGLYLQLGEPIATSCTSAQATRNYVPGLTEAFYKHIPILAITTSKLSRYTYQDYMQAPDQISLPKDSVKKSFDIPHVCDIDSREVAKRDIKTAILELKHRTCGPVQLNLRVSDRENGLFEDLELPILSPLKRYTAWDNWDDIDFTGKKILVVMGEHRPYPSTLIKAIDSFCESYNVAVYTNNISNFHGAYSIKANLLITCNSLRKLDLVPDIVITVGGQTGDYSIYGPLSNPDNKFEHWRISEDGAVVDTYSKLTKIFECPEELFFNRMSNRVMARVLNPHSYFHKWKTYISQMNVDIDLPFSNLYAAQQLYTKLPHNCYMNYAILNSLRVWNFFDLADGVKGFSNVGAFGIDGGLSTLIGTSINTNELCFMITGDLAYFYDMNVLGIRHIKNNVRILVVNNNGGYEFKAMTRPWKEKPDLRPYISACDHYKQTKGWATDCGFMYMSAKNKDEFNSQISIFTKENDRPIIFEIFTKDEDELEAIITILHINNLSKGEDSIKQAIRNLMGNKTYEAIKTILKKN